MIFHLLNLVQSHREDLENGRIMRTKVCGIYKIESIINPCRIYIGSSVDIFDRWVRHLKDLRNNTHHSKKLQRHYNKYGKLDLKFSILLGCDKGDLIPTEQYFLDCYIPYFNSSLMACSCLGYKHTEEARKNMSEGQKRRGKHPPEHNLKMSLAMKGKYIGYKHNETSLQHMRDAHLGKKCTEETKEKMREAQRIRRLKEAEANKIINLN